MASEPAEKVVKNPENLRENLRDLLQQKVKQQKAEAQA